MASVSKQLLAALDDLVTDELKRFKWHLKGHKSFSAAALEKADAPDTVDLMMKRFGPEEAVMITVDILKEMNHNHLAEELEKKHKQAQAESSRGAPGPAGAQSKPINETLTNIVPRTRRDFLQYSHQLTPDLNTAHKWLLLSENKTKISGILKDQPYPDHPDRFDVYEQVLCEESVSGCCYWEIELSADAFIAVSYKSISRKGGAECEFGCNDQSWSLYCSRSSYSFMHNNTRTDLPVKPISRRIGVFVDPRAGTLSFYSVSTNTMTLIHTVQTTFTQPLYPGFRVGSGASVKLLTDELHDN